MVEHEIIELSLDAVCSSDCSKVVPLTVETLVGVAKVCGLTVL